ncbi:MAG: hypothetical protein M0C28_26415 [Candidatus Moduliflexus flocculans]|nr:hypothetical protein [Candidatus Moduliflexus flocculans]
MPIQRTVPVVCLLAAALFVLPAALRPSQDPAAVPAAGAPGLRYEIWVELDDAEKTLLGKEEIVWTNPTAEAVPDMLLHLYWNAFKNEDSAFLREAAAESMFSRGAAPEDGEWGWIDITDIRLADGSDLKPTLHYVTPDGPEHPDDQTVARVLFPAPVQPGESVRIRLEFRSKVPRTVARSGYYRDSFFIAQWYPKPGVYEAGKGWNAHAYHQNSEFFADFADFVVHIDVPSRFVVGSSGKQTGAAVDGAAGRTTYTYRQAMVHDFAWTADPRYIKIERDFIGDAGGHGGGIRGDRRAPRPGARRGPASRRPDDPAHRAGAQRPDRAPLPGPPGGPQVLRPLVRPLSLRDRDHGRSAVPDRKRRHGVPDPVHGGHADPAQPQRPLAGGRHRPRVRPRLLVRTGGQQRVRGGLARRGLQHLLDGEGPGQGLRARGHVLRFQGFSPRLVPPPAPESRFRAQPGRGHQHRPLRSRDRLVLAVLQHRQLRRQRLHARRDAPRDARTAPRRAGLVEDHADLPHALPVQASDQVRFRRRRQRDLRQGHDLVLRRALRRHRGLRLRHRLRVLRQGPPPPPRRVRRGRRPHGMDRQEDRGARKGRGRRPGGPPQAAYRTTVVLRRFGEARLGGDARVEVLVRFKDGTTETRTWDGQARWARLEFVKPAEVASAEIDPAGVWLIDENLANNSRGADGLRRNVVKMITQHLFLLQNLFQFIGSWI